MMRYVVAVFFLSVAFSQSLLAQGKINYTISNGVQIAGLDGTNPVIYDNDWVLDTPELFYLWLKANRRQINLVGNISTRNLYLPPNVVDTHDKTYVEWVRAYDAAMATGLQNIPQPIKGADWYLTKPASGVPEETVRKDSPGSDLIISEALKASPSKPLVIIIGGQPTTLANAYLKNNSIADRIIVFHVDGYGVTQFNGVDYWATEIVVRRMKYINWDGNLNSWYTPYAPIPVSAAGIPNNPFAKLYMDNYYNYLYQIFGDLGDAPPAAYLANHSLWRNVVRKNMANQTITADNYDFLLVSDNDFAGLGAEIGNFVRDPNNYIPVSQPSNQAPSVSITSPSNNASFTVGSSISLSANASDNDGSVQRVEFFHGSTKIGEDLSSPYSFVWSSVNAGTYSITAKATDNAGATTTSGAVSITVTANTAPTVSITSPANNADFVLGSNIAIAANATDANGTVARVEFYNGTTKIGEDTSSPYSYTWVSPAPGNHTLTAKAFDNLGAVTTSSAVTVSVIAPNVSPTVALTSPVHNATFASGSTVTITANATDNDGTVSKVEFYYGTTKIGEDATAPYSIVWNSVSPGTYSISAKVTDNDGAIANSSSISISVQAPNGSPTVSLTGPANNANFISGSNITITATASDADGTVSRVEFFRGTTKLGEDTSSPYSFVWNSVAAGTYAISAKATDNLNLSVTSATVSITVTAPNTPPTVSLTAPANNASFNTNSAITLTANATDANGSVTKVEFFNGAAKLGEDATAPYGFVWNNVPNGNYILSAKATDNNNAVTTSTAVNIVVRPNPVAPVVNITSPADGAVIDSGTTIVISATASTPTGSILKTEFFNGTTKLGEDATAPYSFNWSNAAPGTYNITVKATSNQALAGNDDVRFTVRGQLIPPNNPPIADAGEDITQGLPVKTLAINGTGTDSDGQVTTYAWTQISGPAEISLSQDNTGDLYLANLVVGVYIFELTVTDNNNLTSKDQVTVTILEEAPVSQNIPRYFTPNNDGVNDLWEWPNIELYANSTLVIFNRFGQKIYETDSYQNNWNGTVDGKPLQEDAYYYSIKLRNADIKGAVRIVR